MTDKVCSKHPEEGVELVLTPEKRFYGRWECKVCRKFITHARNPDVSEEFEARRERIALIMQQHASVLAMSDIHTLLKFYSRAHLNDYQRIVYDTLVERLPVEEWDVSSSESEGSKSCLLD